MAHESLYRKHRPNSFADVVGQDQVTRPLSESIKSGKISHAYLFSGSRGLGKTSVARIFAREINKGGYDENDVYEIDAASNNSVEDIRLLIDGVYTLPFGSAYKVYILDEAHMLSKAAWNALLKTLEEPPAHAIFVLATTERDKVPDTIQSRCEVYAFKQPTREVLAEAVRDVAKKEGYSLEGSAAELVALLAEGSFRDALSILQKVLAVTNGKKIDIAEVEIVSNAPRGELVRRLLSGVAKKNAAEALGAIEEAVSQNIDARILAKLLIHRLRVVLLLRYAPELAEELSRELSAEDTELARELSKERGVNSDTLKKLLDAYATIPYAAVSHLPLELAVVEICENAKESA